MHCFNKYENQKICPDFEVSYLIECKQPLEQNPIRNQRRHQQNKLSCAINNTNATVPTILISTSPTMLSSTSLTSNGRATSIKFMYLMIIFVGLLIWSKYAKVHLCTEIQSFSKKTWLLFFSREQTIDLFPASTCLKEGCLILLRQTNPIETDMTHMRRLSRISNTVLVIRLRRLDTILHRYDWDAPKFFDRYFWVCRSLKCVKSKSENKFSLGVSVISVQDWV